MRFWIFILISLPVSAFAQTDSTWTIQLNEAEVVARQWYANGHDNQLIDSGMLAQLPAADLDQLLGGQLGLFLRNYGPAGLSMLSLRGTAPHHTAIMWEGLPLNSPMNGVHDLSLIPAFFITNALVQPGGGSTWWGSGAIGGAIQMESALSFQQPLSIRSMTKVGSWNQLAQGVALQAGNRHWSVDSRIFYQQAVNDYWIYHNGEKSHRQPHANTQQLGALQSIGWRNKLNAVSLKYWHQQAARDIAPAVGAQWNGAHQTDDYHRAMVKGRHRLSKDYSMQWQLAYLRESFTYKDSLQPRPAFSTATTLLTDGKIARIQGRHLLWEAGLSGQNVWAAAPGYRDGYTLAQGYGYARGTYIKNQWQTGLAARWGAAQGYNVPPVGQWWLRWSPKKWWTIKGELSRDFRLPTLNDRYWKPGGNPNLQPERSWGQELAMVFAGKSKLGKMEHTVVAYHRWVDQWILWQPKQGIWTPENVQAVRSRGIENRFSWRYHIANWQWQLLLSHQWQHATKEATQIPQDPTLGKQLIYTPVHQGFIRLTTSWKQWHLLYSHRFVGQRFTTTTNSHALPAYQVADLQLQYQWPWRQHLLQIQLQMLNAGNTSYAIMMGRRMPGRSYQCTFQLLLNTKTSTR